MEEPENKPTDWKDIEKLINEKLEEARTETEADQKPNPEQAKMDMLTQHLCAITECAEMLRRNIEVVSKVTHVGPDQVLKHIRDWVGRLNSLSFEAHRLVIKDVLKTSWPAEDRLLPSASSSK